MSIERAMAVWKKLGSGCTIIAGKRSEREIPFELRLRADDLAFVAINCTYDVNRVLKLSFQHNLDRIDIELIDVVMHLLNEDGESYSIERVLLDSNDSDSSANFVTWRSTFLLGITLQGKFQDFNLGHSSVLSTVNIPRSLVHGKGAMRHDFQEDIDEVARRSKRSCAEIADVQRIAGEAVARVRSSGSDAAVQREQIRKINACAEEHIRKLVDK